MTETNNSHGSRRRTWPNPTRGLDTNNGTDPRTPRTHSNGAKPPPADVIAHLVTALSMYLRHLRADSKRSPAQLEDLSMFLTRHVTPCRDVPLLDGSYLWPHPSTVPSRLLLTKPEAAEQLGVSLRTIERLISAGRLPLVHVEGAARLRVADIETYVQGLEADARINPSPAEER